jgi:hypothetical protein
MSTAAGDAAAGNGAAGDAAAGNGAPAGPLDLDRIEGELAAVEQALARLDAGTYWTDEVTGAEIPAEALRADPLIRRAPAE